MTFGLINKTVDFGLRRDMFWDFYVADIPYSVIGADFLSHFDLVPDLKRLRLVDNITSLSVRGTLQEPPFLGVNIIDPSHKYAHIL